MRLRKLVALGTHPVDCEVRIGLSYLCVVLMPVPFPPHQAALLFLLTALHPQGPQHSPVRGCHPPSVCWQRPSLAVRKVAAVSALSTSPRGAAALPPSTCLLTDPRDPHKPLSTAAEIYIGWEGDIYILWSDYNKFF